MVAIAQSVEHLIVVQEVARSSRVSHPSLNPCSPNELGVSLTTRPRHTRLVCHLCVIIRKTKLASTSLEATVFTPHYLMFALTTSHTNSSYIILASTFYTSSCWR